MKRLLVGMGTCGLSAGARGVHDRLGELLAGHPDRGELAITGCIGMCYCEPLVEVRENGRRVVYGEVTPARAEEIVSRHVVGGEILDDYVVYRLEEGRPASGREADFMAPQERIVLRNCGVIDPESIAEYEAAGGYEALRKALFEMTPAAIIEEMKASLLRGRGGAGFPTGLKWSFAAGQASDTKYVVCNADEGDPGAFMDRSVLEGDPHAVLEGMIVCARAIGGTHGYVYCRAEYPLALKRLEIALAAARERGYLGKNILGSDFSFDVKIKQGAGAFVCGEETALFASIEGERGMPRIRPPFPAEKGLWRKPTNNNNVETYANVPWILTRGAAAYRRFGTEKSPGTKVFALAGKVRRGGLAEVPMGMTIHDLVHLIGGGIKEGRAFKAVQMGGPSGGCIPSGISDTPVDFEHIPPTGAIMGSGGMVVLDDTSCMVEIARFFLEFTQNESCGKCTFCRIGTLRMLEALERITRGEGAPADIVKLEKLAVQIKEASLCGLGQTAPNPVQTTLRYYRQEYEAHIARRECPARYCEALVDFFIDAEKCTGCTLCAKNCPVQAITGEPKKLHVIDQSICVKCSRCIASCSFGAVYKN
ncbi:MAG: NADH-quinone oxidoreductase subunit NuoF [Candidatus Eisenbacteria bacterium]|uniref:NADH-quinone oxidoreductase subunit NuoF n=1 Tax=Eiseniibacteriota bacterium TaxID=2212470 RepID=A0A938BQH0_UNCEI|nr:NADH-quinone oxidoreductase subunit NuoF [Candidatus Eisenbacteria bacterium]